MRIGESNPALAESKFLPGRGGGTPRKPYKFIGFPEGTSTDPYEIIGFQRGWGYFHRSSEQADSRRNAMREARRGPRPKTDLASFRRDTVLPVQTDSEMSGLDRDKNHR